ncbi:TatD family hydrolase [Bacterioplanoides sp.]|uniref:TatD family hydrolase n=1 Tax=Bacterioplanoides sp. TaxID=2066072 RepID=UPI003AFFBBEF
MNLLDSNDQECAPTDLIWIDSHCHFDFPQWHSQRDEHWQLAQTLGVQSLIIPGITIEQNQQVAQFCADTPWQFALGLHPYFLAQHGDNDLDALERLLSRTVESQQSPAIAVGEIGLDWVLAKQADDPDAARAQQWQLFEAQVVLAERYQLPLILHIRGCHDQAASWLRRRRFSFGGIVHAFSGSEQQAKAWLDLGFKLGIGGAMTFPRANKLRNTISSLPLSAWVLETDAPDMRPAFFRQGVSSPVAIPLYGAILATLKQVSLMEVSVQNQNNLLSLFPGLKT